MKTTIDIPEDALRDAMRFTKAKTKRQAVLVALEEFNRRNRMAALARHFGTFDSLISNEEIERLESSRGRAMAR
jgi:Arc/MetJ family transcription regulator